MTEYVNVESCRSDARQPVANSIKASDYLDSLRPLQREYVSDFQASLAKNANSFEAAKKINENGGGRGCEAYILGDFALETGKEGRAPVQRPDAGQPATDQGPHHVPAPPPILRPDSGQPTTDQGPQHAVPPPVLISDAGQPTTDQGPHHVPVPPPVLIGLAGQSTTDHKPRIENKLVVCDGDDGVGVHGQLKPLPDRFAHNKSNPDLAPPILPPACLNDGKHL